MGFKIYLNNSKEDRKEGPGTTKLEGAKVKQQDGSLKYNFINNYM